MSNKISTQQVEELLKETNDKNKDFIQFFG